ncbi:MAG TPA: hypothetical protein VGD64_12310 [Acidisarcina sp.]
MVALTARVSATMVAVRHPEGAAHGFLVIRDNEGKILAAGDLIQVSHGTVVTARLVFHFRDGSIDDERSVFTDEKAFRLISDHHVQKGPSYPHPTDIAIDARSGMVTVRSVDKDGKPKISTEHMDLPPDVANGLTFVLVKNIPPNSPELKLPAVVATPKPRLIHIAIASHGDEMCYIGGVQRKVTHYVGKLELGGVTGVVAPIIGKQPHDLNIWVLGGIVPAILKVQGQLFEDGPIWNIEVASPTWPHAAEKTR